MKIIEKVYAQIDTTPISPLDTEPTSIWELVVWVTNMIIIVGAAIFLVMLAFGFIKYLTSRGDKEGVESAQNILTYAVIGGIGLLLIYALREILFNMLGVNEEALQQGTESTETVFLLTSLLS